MKTRITELFNIKYPIVQSPMASIGHKSLVIATCNAGGLGLFAPPGFTLEQVREQIREIRKNVNGKLFGVNIMPVMPKVRDLIQLLIEEEVPVWSSSFRNPFTFFNVKRPRNVIYLAAVGDARQAISVEKQGADAVMVQSLESGGHSGKIASTVLIPEVVRAVKIPVVAAGGFCDGKGLVAALALGAEGIAMGTRFAVTQESPLPEELKKKYLEARDTDAILTPVWDGMPLRAISERRGYRGWWTHPWDILPSVLALKKEFHAGWGEMLQNIKYLRQMHASAPQFAVGMAMFRQTLATRDIKRTYAPAGQVIGLIEDIPTCQELLDRTVDGAEKIILNMYAWKMETQGRSSNTLDRKS